MTCLDVRELLPELAVGVLSAADRAGVERHLQWCAGCRKEASDLGQAAATFGFTLTPAPVPQGLGERVVARVGRSAGAPGTARRARTAAAAIVAAMVAVASLGWGAVMAGRADRFAERAALAERNQATALEQFQRTIAQLFPGRTVSESDMHLSPLSPVAAGTGGGFALQLVSPRLLDFSMVIVNGLDPTATRRLPYRVRIVNPSSGKELRAGRIEELDADGGAQVFHQFKRADLSGFTDVVVVDAAGEVVLSGTVDQSP
ncbi:MAG: zf-HC2 domain-containing protein [Actinobacteria bacterium]|nr:zf-HC2 domain-containing protein [Actinomycetota bacterium]